MGACRQGRKAGRCGGGCPEGARGARGQVDTMIEAPRPTRAEATDVANLVLDGCDGILLGAETWVGRDPPATAKTVLDIARQARPLPPPPPPPAPPTPA